MMSDPGRRRRRARSDEAGQVGAGAPAEAGQVVLDRPALMGAEAGLEEPRLALLERAVRRSRVLLMVLDADGVILLAEGGGTLGLALDPHDAVGRPALACLG